MHDRNAAGRFWPVATVLVVAWFAALGLVMQTTVPSDVGWYLVSTRLWLEGAELYSYIVEVNPPLAFYLAAPAIWISDGAMIDGQAALFVYLAGLIAVSLAWCCRLIRMVSPGRQHYALLCAAIFCSMFLVPSVDFGQREHFTIVFCMPLALMTATLPARSLRWQERVAIALFALPGLALKPYFLAAPFLMTVAHIAMARGLGERLKALFSPENLTIGIGCVAYLAFVWFRYPAYFEIIIPLAQATYTAIEHDHAGPMKLMAVAIVVLVPAALFLAARSAPQADRPVIILLCAATGFGAAYLAQAKGWSYHGMPAVAFGIVALAWYAGTRLAAGDRSLAPVIVIAAIGYMGAVKPLISGPDKHPETLDILARHGDRLEGRVIAGWSPMIQAGFPLVNVVHGDWALGYPSIWPLPGALNARSDPDPAVRETGTRIIDDLRRTLVDELIDKQPDIILLPIQLGENFLRLLAKDPRFEPAFAAYEKIDTIGDMQIWERRAANVADRG